MMRHSWRFMAVFALGLALRLGFVLVYPQFPVEGDAGAYDVEAAELVRGNTSFLGQGAAKLFAKGPVYPLFLAAIYRGAGYHHPAARVVQALMSAASLVLIYAIAQTIFGSSVASVALFLAVLYPPFISYPGQLLTETLSVWLVAAFLFALLKGLGGASLGWWALAGGIGGVLTLHRAELILLVMLCAAYLARWHVGWRRLGMFMIGVFLIVAPWVARNYAVFHRWILVSPQAGEVVWISSYEREWLGWHDNDPSYRTIVDGLSSLRAQDAMCREGLKNIMKQPLTYAWMCLKRIPRFWIGGHSNTFVGLEQDMGVYARAGAWGKVSLKLAMLGWNMSLICLGVTGLVLAWRFQRADPRHLTLLVLPVVVKAVTHTLLFATLRFQVPIMSCLIIGAAYALWAVLGRKPIAVGWRS